MKTRSSTAVVVGVNHETICEKTGLTRTVVKVLVSAPDGWHEYHDEFSFHRDPPEWLRVGLGVIAVWRLGPDKEWHSFDLRASMLGSVCPPRAR